MESLTQQDLKHVAPSDGLRIFEELFEMMHHGLPQEIIQGHLNMNTTTKVQLNATERKQLNRLSSHFINVTAKFLKFVPAESFKSKMQALGIKSATCGCFMWNMRLEWQQECE